MLSNPERVKKSLASNYDAIDSFFKINGEKLNGLNATQLAYKFLEVSGSQLAQDYVRKLISAYLKERQHVVSDVRDAFVKGGLEGMETITNHMVDSFKLSSGNAKTVIHPSDKDKPVTDGSVTFNPDDLKYPVSDGFGNIKSPVEYSKVNTDPSGIFAYKGEAPPSLVYDMKKQWEEQILGVNNNHKISFINSTGIDDQYKHDDTRKDFKSQNLEFNIDEWIDQGLKIQELANKATGQFVDEKFVELPIPKNGKDVSIAIIADLHYGNIGTDFNMIRKITNDLLENDNLYCILLGDILENSIRLRSVDEISNSIFSADQQIMWFDKWLDTIKHKVICAYSCNHQTQRELELTGSSQSANILRRYTQFIDGIGYLTVKVGSQSYKFVGSHKFKGAGNSLNPTNGIVKYMDQSARDREIGIGADSHVGGVMHFHNQMKQERLALNTGTANTKSMFARRHFTLHTQSDMPCVTLSHINHKFIGFRNIDDWKHVTQV